MTVEKILQGLNTKQKEAVTTTEGYVRVVAGAGSGKTRALTQRYAYIVKGLGISTSNILSVTFTNKAAAEMRKRVRQLIGEGYDTGLIATYHGFCVRVLREDIHLLKYPKRFIILDEEDQKTILREIYDELGINITHGSFNKMLKYITKMKANPNYVRFMTSTQDRMKTSEVDGTQQKVYHKYLLKQKKVFGLDFDDLINFTFVLFEDFPHVLEKWQNRIHYVQVDEFQDSSEKQIQLIDMVSRKNGNLFVVGDPDQTIYEWRGAKPEYFVNFDKVYPSCKTIILNENFRSTPQILDVGNAIIKNNKLRIDKDMFTKNPPGIKVIHYHGKDEPDEIKWITNRIKTLVDERQAKLSDIAILYRANYLSRFIEQGLIREGIDYTIYGGFRFFQRKEIKDALAYLRLVSSGDDLSFLRVINTPRRNIGKKRIQFIKDKAEAEDLTYLDVLRKYIDEPILSRTKAKQFLNLIDKYRENYREMSVSELLQNLLQESGYDAYLREDGDQDRIDNVSELFNSIVAYEQSVGEETTLEEYLQAITLYTDYEKAEERDCVKLMTIHTAKGLEFPYVFLAGFTDGVLPNSRALEERKKRGLEEERRLAYVAVTRAMKEFYMTESEGFTSRGNVKRPSRFIFEIEESLYDRIGILEESFVQETLEAIKASESEAAASHDDTLKFSEGDAVEHPVFGQGKITTINEKQRVYHVSFDELDSIKPISFDFEGLKKLEYA